MALPAITDQIPDVRPLQGGASLTLRSHVNRIAELIVNVTDLEKSLRFYETLTPLRVVRRTQAAQTFRTLGMESGSFMGAVLADGSSGQPGVTVHLIQWLDPQPVGPAYPSFFHRGFYRFCFLTN